MAESDDVDDVEEQEFLRLSSELGAEFVRLVLGEAGRDGDEGTASMGPGDGKESEGASGGSEEPPRDPPPRPDNPVIRSLALKLRQTGNEIDSPDLERVLRVMTPVLQKISVFQVTQTVFSSICDRVLGGIQTSSGWTQVRAVYHVALELIRRLRQEDPNPTREATFNYFAGQYLLRVGLSSSMRLLLRGIAEKLLFPSVDVSYDPPEQ